MNSKRFIRVIAIFAAILLSFASVYAASNYNITTTKPSNINEWNICRRVLNNAGKDIFVPTKTLAEWQTFMNNLPSGVSLAFCTPTPPLSLSAARQGTQGLLSWSSPSTNYGSAITNIKIYRSTSSGSETLYATVGNVNSYTDPSVSSSLIYYYKVLAVNGGGDGDFSNEAQIGTCDPNIITTFGTWSSCSKTCGGGTRTRTNINQCGNSVIETDNNCNPTPCCDANVIVSCSGCAAGTCSTKCGAGTCTQTCTNQCGGTVQQTIGCTDTSDAGKILSCGSCGACSTKCGTGTCSKTCNLVCGGTTTQTDTCTDKSGIGNCPSASSVQCGQTVTDTCGISCGYTGTANNQDNLQSNGYWDNCGVGVFIHSFGCTVCVYANTFNPYFVVGPDMAWGWRGTHCFGGHACGYYSVNTNGGYGYVPWQYSIVTPSGIDTGCGGTASFLITRCSNGVLL